MVKCIAKRGEKRHDIPKFSLEISPKFFESENREEGNQRTVGRLYDIPRPPVFVKRCIIHDHLPRLHIVILLDKGI
ncbi:MAG: hypothetical protein LBR91_02955 [Puniceicoccales bacterium]|nr:hypothetical protein [Puniceicoccales bacterium]